MCLRKVLNKSQTGRAERLKGLLCFKRDDIEMFVQIVQILNNFPGLNCNYSFWKTLKNLGRKIFLLLIGAEKKTPSNLVLGSDAKVNVCVCV